MSIEIERSRKRTYGVVRDQTGKVMTWLWRYLDPRQQLR